jgi:hypothetical protein
VTDVNINVQTDLTPIVAAIAKELWAPYADFVKQLRAEGRVTDAEVKQLQEKLRARWDDLPDLVQGRLQDGTPEAGNA